MTFNQVSEESFKSVADKRNYIPRKSLGYQTPVEAFFKEMAKRKNQTTGLSFLKKNVSSILTLGFII